MTVAKLPLDQTLSDADMQRWSLALRQLPEHPAGLPIWIDGPLRDFFQFERMFCVHGELIAGQIRATHWLGSGYTDAELHLLAASFELAQRASLSQWLQSRQPFYLDANAPPAHASAFEIEEMTQVGVRNLAAHGIVNARANAGTYFSFANVQHPPSAWHLQALRLIAPVLNDLFLTHVSNLTPHSVNAIQLTPRQKEIIRKVVAGDCDKTIANTLHISEKTVRNQLSMIYETLGVDNRTRLAALFR
jgi:DNA-binding CsgD family transcriptional regulator